MLLINVEAASDSYFSLAPNFDIPRLNHNICILEPCTEIVADSNSLLIKLQKIFSYLLNMILNNSSLIVYQRPITVSKFPPPSQCSRICGHVSTASRSELLSHSNPLFFYGWQYCFLNFYLLFWVHPLKDHWSHLGKKNIGCQEIFITRYSII